MIWRTRADGTLGCATPCVLCQRELRRFDLRVHCPLSAEDWFSGRLDEGNAPEPKFTSRQRLCLLPRGAVDSSASSSSGGGSSGRQRSGDSPAELAGPIAVIASGRQEHLVTI